MPHPIYFTQVTIDGVDLPDFGFRSFEAHLNDNDPFQENDIPCWHADSDRLNEIPELFTIRQMEQR